MAIGDIANFFAKGFTKPSMIASSELLALALKGEAFRNAPRVIGPSSFRCACQYFLIIVFGIRRHDEKKSACHSIGSFASLVRHTTVGRAET